MKKVRVPDAKVLLIIIMIIQCCFMLYYCNMKQGFFVDEIWSYGLSNSYYHGQIWEDGAMDDIEMPAESFRDYIEVNPGEEFSYGSVIYNQTRDVHPPLFYLVLHTVSSFFPGEFSKWFGLIPNIVYYLITILILYRIGRLFSDNKYFALMPVLLYGFSIAAVNSVIYIRMYMLMALWGALFAYFHLVTILNRKIRKRDFCILLISTFFGMLTHYFFAIFACPWVIAYLVWTITRKKWKDLIPYACTGGIAAVSVCVLYPAYIQNVLGTKEGHAQSLNTSGESLLSRLQEYIGLTGKEMFAGMFGFIIILGLLILAVWIALKVIWTVHVSYVDGKYYLQFELNKTAKKNMCVVKREYYLAAVMAFSVVFYYIICAMITPWISNRYVMVQYPFAAVLMCLFIYGIMTVWGLKSWKRDILTVLCILLVGGLTYFFADPEYIYDYKKDNVSISAQYSDLPCAYIYSDERAYIMVNNALELQNYSKVYQMWYQLMDDEVPNIDAPDGLVLYIDKSIQDDKKISVETCVSKVMQLKSYTKQKILYEDDSAYVIHVFN